MIIRANQLTKSLWKNGGGVTTEIARFPAAGNFDWRLSFAEVSQSGPFSIFAGYDRALIVCEGEGLRLNDHFLLPLTPFYFSGDDPIDATLLGGPILDLGLIYKRSKFTSSLVVFDDPTTVLGTPSIIFVISGAFTVNGELLNPRDSYVPDEGSRRAEMPPEFRAALPGSRAVAVLINRK